MAITRKLRILCLHGYRGTARVLRDQMRALVAGTESLADYVCFDAPSLKDGDFGWWHAVDSPTATGRGDPGVRGASHSRGWTRTRGWLESTFAEQGPFDGVFGFSQGAALAGLLVGLRAPGGRATSEQPIVFDYAVVVSGFATNDPAHAALYSSRESYDLPSLHLIGRSDFIVPPAKSFELAAAFSNPMIVEHDGGHVIASTAVVRDRYQHFLAARLDERTNSSPTSPRSAQTP